MIIRKVRPLPTIENGSDNGIEEAREYLKSYFDKASGTTLKPIANETSKAELTAIVTLWGCDSISRN